MKLRFSIPESSNDEQEGEREKEIQAEGDRLWGAERRQNRAASPSFYREGQGAGPDERRDLFAEIGTPYTTQGLDEGGQVLRVAGGARHQENRHILLFVDNVSSHDDAPVTLSNVKVKKLPPSMRAGLQPMDQGTIKRRRVSARSSSVASDRKQM
ncbi:hypothetical protein PF011_g18658 [Phytophthora fragariae]|uniref:DDE-1 domain-containing protein n=1 Tax=Phytophthora fragariae TaxID=53985 RepID=A0A6A3J2T2_9STRA|nr:hypothetical protein PF011_g18658 [Phytophthora fragariae]